MENNKNDIYVISVEDTKKYGIISAAIIGRVRWWCKYNEENKVKDRYHENNWWSGFMSSKEFSEQLGMPVKTIEKHLSILVKSKVLFKDNFNKRQYDRTCWYRVNPFPPIEETIYSNRGNGTTLIGEMDLLQKGKPIPVNLSVKQNVKQTGGLSVNPETSFLSVEDRLKELNELIKLDNFITNEERGFAFMERNKLERELKQLITK